MLAINPPLTGHAAQIERIKSRPLGVAPKKIREFRIRYHECFSQLDGDPRPQRCRCRKISQQEALDLVRRGEADWIEPLPKRGARAVVRRQTRDKIKERALIDKLRRRIQKSFARGLISSAEAGLSSEEILLGWADLEAFGQTHPMASKQLLKIFSNQRLADKKLGVNQGRFMPQADRGKGAVVVVAPKKLEEIAVHWDEHERGIRSNMPGTFIPGPFIPGNKIFGPGRDGTADTKDRDESLEATYESESTLEKSYDTETREGFGIDLGDEKDEK